MDDDVKEFMSFLIEPFRLLRCNHIEIKGLATISDDVALSIVADVTGDSCPEILIEEFLTFRDMALTLPNPYERSKVFDFESSVSLAEHTATLEITAYYEALTQALDEIEYTLNQGIRDIVAGRVWSTDDKNGDRNYPLQDRDWKDVSDDGLPNEVERRKVQALRVGLTTLRTYRNTRQPVSTL